MASGGGVTLLSLAYLIEISVVLNLAYRELKFADLHKKLKRTIDEIKKDKIKDLSAAIEKYPAFIALTELADDKVGNREGVEEIWRHACNLKLFYYNFIVSMKSLRIVNWSILANVVALIVFIFFSDIQFQATRIENFFYSLAGVAATLIIIALGVFANRYLAIAALLVLGIYLPSLINAFPFLDLAITYNSPESFLWGVALGVFTALTITPLLLIKMTTACEVFLLGHDGDGSGGEVKVLADKIHKEHKIAKEENDVTVTPPKSS